MRSRAFDSRRLALNKSDKYRETETTLSAVNKLRFENSTKQGNL